MQSKHYPLLMALIFVAACNPSSNWKEEASNPESLHQSMKRITDVIVHDIFSPPVASRIYAYSSVAAYEALRPGYPGYKSLAGQLRDLGPTPQPAEGEEYCFQLAAVHAMLTVGRTMIFSEDSIAVFELEINDRYKKMGLPRNVYKRSMDYGKAVADHILAWADKDNYKQTRSFPKYTVSNDPAKWRPTPPDYMDGIEPHWNKIRPFMLDSASQFVPGPPTAFDPKPGSKFYEEAMEVYRAAEGDRKEERIEIAAFWDCNPYVSTHVGHVMYATKKITPGGHWMGITQIACKQAGADAMKSAEAYARVAIALADGFISCWDEKYRSNLVRPETFINVYVDENWRPVLQTPPFPEHTSGHSVISSAAAMALTHLFGSPFPFEDNVEEEYGLPRRSFNSFIEASEEAAVSRLYGGIHYRPAIDFGVEQGRKVGHWVNQHLTTEIK
ncbi:MAG: vanadium-dependent haloperoxidase [Saprospiraceae bacterium]